MGESSIQWTHFTFNPWLGCAKAHTGCTHCYAEKHQAVAMRQGGRVQWGEVWQGGQRVVTADSTWAKPLTWARQAAREGVRKRVFCASLADVLEVPDYPPFAQLTTESRARVNEVRQRLDEARARLWNLIRETAHICQGCERPHATSADVGGRTARLADLASVGAACEGSAGRCVNTGSGGLDWLLLTKRPENWAIVPADVRPLVWLGTSISDQETADEWVPRLLDAPDVRLRFLSVEPLTGPVDLWAFLTSPLREQSVAALGSPPMPGIDWVIVGGESGPKARPCRVEWVRDIVRQCREAGVPCFVKQLGARVIDTPPGPRSLVDAAVQQSGGWRRLLEDSHGGDMAEWPEDLRVREVPS